ncbi:hypothetical protein BDW60DRAFT_186315 [Aspergillus nidulans var. acristatus]
MLYKTCHKETVSSVSIEYLNVRASRREHAVMNLGFWRRLLSTRDMPIRFPPKRPSGLNRILSSRIERSIEVITLRVIVTASLAVSLLGGGMRWSGVKCWYRIKDGQFTRRNKVSRHH